MKSFPASKINLWLGVLLILGALLMLVFYPSVSPAALLVVGLCNVAIAYSAKGSKG